MEHHLLTPVTKTATWTITTEDSGTIFLLNHATSIHATLPAARAGIYYTFVVQTLTAADGHKVKAPASSNINGGTDNQSWQCTAATDVLGDCVTVVCDGTDWHTISQKGIWAAVA